MSPKEKAFELFQKFRLPNGSHDDEDGVAVNHYKVAKYDAKQCALICVDEMLNNLCDLEFSHDLNLKMDFNYWQSVKTELQKP